MAEPAPTRPRSRAWSSPAATYYLLITGTALLTVVGLAAMLSSSSIDSIKIHEGDPYALFKAQLLYLGIGVALMLAASRMPVGFFRRAAPWALATSLVLLFLVAAFGTESGGNRNWLDLGFLTAQPSEAAKLALALYLGLALAHLRPRLVTVKQALVPAGLVSIGVIGLVLAGSDVGTATVMIMLAAAAFWTAGLPVRFFAMGLTVATAAVAILVWNRPSRLIRVTAWLNPECDPSAECLQTTHGTWALASGGIWGLGPGLSREKWSYLPKAHNDFIFAILGEEFGLVGTLLVLAALAMLVLGVHRIVRRSRDAFVQISAAAIGAWIIGQASLNIAVVLSLAPVTGVPLPLVSSGGSALIMTLVGIGVLLAFARREPGAREQFSTRVERAEGSMAVVARGRRGHG